METVINSYDIIAIKTLDLWSKIPCKVSISMCGTCLYLLLLERWVELNEELHIETKEETVLGSFLTLVQEPERQNAKSKNSRNNAGKKRKPDQQPPPLNDIRNSFRTQQRKWIMEKIVGTMVKKPCNWLNKCKKELSIESQHGFLLFFTFFSLCKAQCAKRFFKIPEKKV